MLGCLRLLSPGLRLILYGRAGVPLPEFMTSGISDECARKMVIEKALPAVNKAMGTMPALLLLPALIGRN